MARRGAGLARRLDFGGAPTAVTGTGRGQTALRLAQPEREGPGKYRLLARRRRLAQIRARHLLEAQEPPGSGGPAGRVPGAQAVLEGR